MCRMVELEGVAEVGLGVVGFMKRSSQVRAVLRVAIGGDRADRRCSRLIFQKSRKTAKDFTKAAGELSARSGRRTKIDSVGCLIIGLSWRLPDNTTASRVPIHARDEAWGRYNGNRLELGRY